MFLSKQFYIPRISTLRFLMESAFPDSSDQCIKCNLNNDILQRSNTPGQNGLAMYTGQNEHKSMFKKSDRFLVFSIFFFLFFFHVFFSFFIFRFQ